MVRASRWRVEGMEKWSAVEFVCPRKESIQFGTVSQSMERGRVHEPPQSVLYENFSKSRSMTNCPGRRYPGFPVRSYRL